MSKKYIVTVVGFWISISMFCCTQNKATEIYSFVKPPEENLDSLNTWFANEENFNNDEGFLKKFQVHFKEKLTQEKWEEAAQLMYHVGQSLILNNSTDTVLIKTNIEFLELHEKAISNRYKSGLYSNIGSLYYYYSKFEESVIYQKKATSFTPENYDEMVNVIDAYKELSYTYTEVGKLDLALKASFKALENCDIIKDTIGIGSTYDAIASIYYSMDDYKNSEIYYDKAIEKLYSAKHDMGVFTVYLNKLGLYDATENKKLFALIDTTYQYYQSCDFNNDSYKIDAYSWYSYKLLKENKVAEARKLLFEIRPLFEKSDEKFLYSMYLSASELYEELTGIRLIDKAIYTEIIPLLKKNNNYESLNFCYDILEKKALKRNDYKVAYKYYVAASNITDSIASQEMILKTKDLDKKYQTEKKEKEIVLQRNELTKKNTFIALLIASIIGLLLVILTYFLWQKQKNLKKDKDNSMNFTKQLLENTEEERKRIASDLHDSISHELLSLKTTFQQDFKNVNAKIDNIINDIRGISRNLHPVMFDKIGLLPNIEQLVERIQAQNDFMVAMELNYHGSLNSANELQIYRIIQEALSNIIKYAKAHAAKITIDEKKDIIFIEIKDNGNGFQVKETLNGNKAFGLHNIIERSRVIGGEAQIHSSNEGTIITINIPKTS